MELSDILGEELLACCRFDTEVLEDVDTDIDRLFTSAFDTAEFESIPGTAPIDVIPAARPNKQD